MGVRSGHHPSLETNHIGMYLAGVVVEVQLELVPGHDHLVQLAERGELVLQRLQGLRHRHVQLLSHVLVQLELRVLEVHVAELHVRARVPEVGARQAQGAGAVELPLHRVPHFYNLFLCATQVGCNKTWGGGGGGGGEACM